MNTTEIRPAKSDSEIQDIAILAEEIWHQHLRQSSARSRWTIW